MGMEDLALWRLELRQIEKQRSRRPAAAQDYTLRMEAGSIGRGKCPYREVPSNFAARLRWNGYMAWSRAEVLSGLLAGANTCSRWRAIDFHHPNRSPIRTTTSNQKDCRYAQKRICFHNLRPILALTTSFLGLVNPKCNPFLAISLLRLHLTFFVWKPLLASETVFHN
jgi:hypothetical protein